MDDWIRFFNAQTEEDLDMLQTKNIGIQTAVEEVKRMSMSERMRARYEAHMKELRDRRAIEAYEREQGYDQGYAQGIEQGINQGIDREREVRIEKMLRKNKTPEEIADFCDYSLKEVEAVREKIHLH